MGNDSYSRFITGTKIALQLGALGLLSTIFLFSERLDPARALLFSDAKVEDMLRQPGITSANFSTVTNGGMSISLQASQARPDENTPGKWFATDIRASLEDPTGIISSVWAPRLEVDDTARRALFSGGIIISRDPNLTVTAQSITLDTQSDEIVAQGPITAAGPFGALEAGLFRIPPAVPGARQQWQFKDGVKLIYNP